MNNQTNPNDATSGCDPDSERDVAVTAQAAKLHEARLKRVLDYQAASLGKEDSLQANLGSLNSGLMRASLLLEETIVKAMESGPRNVEALAPILPAIDTYMRATRQVDRFAQSELRAAEACKPEPNAGIDLTPDHRASQCLEAPSVASLGQSEDSQL